MKNFLNKYMYLTVIQIVNNGILPSFDWIAKTEVKKNKLSQS